MQYTFVTSGKDREKSFIFFLSHLEQSVRVQNEQHLHEYNIGKKIFVKIEFAVFLIVKIRKRVESINRQQWTSHRDAACFKNQAQQAEVQFCSRLNLLAAV
ncbi:hypothetical protein T05_659 [Trichinella murrelli]|uniref:Uncharacterized protein n=1 Tax=Trichinella murrelli TaxID=144512 RepID=A0A0V0TY42_9BILA|nr:hypothetical protein T05_659 [Trichinella murrelli]